MSTHMRMSTNGASDGHAMSDMASAYLDALRAAGANLVIASHVLALYFGIRDPYALGNLGVAVFFLLSGFLIMQSMLNWLNKPEPRLPGFVADRVARIMTPYVPALVLIALLNLVLIDTNHSQGGTNTGLLTVLAAPNSVLNPTEQIVSSTMRTVMSGLRKDPRYRLIIFDLPPMLTSDDFLAFLPQVDAALLVASAGETTVHDIAECERLIDPDKLLGCVLNKVAESEASHHYYG